MAVLYGDSDNNNVVDASDVAMIANDAGNYVSGYVMTDLNGDTFVDATDFSICDNNAQNFIGTVRP